ncbi:MAG: patatin-like phospholipase family protein [Candidatus Bipolaricaulia bacterium]
MARRRIGLVLSSGGARGSAHIGVLDVLLAEGLAPDIVVGASMGAYVGAAYAAGISLDVLKEEWQSSSFLRTARTLLPTVPWSGWSSGAELMRTLREHFGDRRIEDLDAPFAAVATNLSTGAAEAMTTGLVAEAVRASLSVPGLFTPVWIDDRLLIDGGVSNPLPVDAAIALGAEVTIAVDVLVEPSEVHLSGLPVLGVRDRRLGITGGPSACDVASRRFHPSVLSVLFQMSTVFQKRLCNLTLAAYPPDVLLRPDFSSDPPCYSRVGCGIEAGVRAAERALEEIHRAVEGAN